jgi:hypothetical protein
MLLKLAFCARRFRLTALSRWFLAVEREIKWPLAERERTRRQREPRAFVELDFGQ